MYCDMTTSEGGWTVFQRRQDKTVRFDRNRTDYKYGFGSLLGEFWLGNDYIHRLTKQRRMELRVDLLDWHNNTKYASYSSFSIDLYRYILNVGSYSGSAGDALSAHNKAMFNVFTNGSGRNERCYRVYSGWWYDGEKRFQSHMNCPRHDSSNLNGNNTIMWGGSLYPDSSMKRSEMKMRPTGIHAGP